MILPIYAGLERIPNSMISASEDLGANPWTTFRRVVLPLAFPAGGGRLDLHLLPHPRRLHHPDVGLAGHPVHRQRRLLQHTNNLPLASAFAMVPIVVMIIYLVLARRLGAFEHL